MADKRNWDLAGDVARVDAAVKVTGRALYPSDVPLDNPAYAALLTSNIARGQITAMRLGKARSVPGVLLIFNHENTAGQIRPETPLAGGSTRTLDDGGIDHDGQIIAMVVAETWEIARQAVDLIEVDYSKEDPSATFGSAGTETVRVSTVREGHVDPVTGDARSAIAAAPVKVSGRYSTPTQHHNSMELYTTTCLWKGDQLVVHEPTQFLLARGYLARGLNIPLDMIRVISHHVGGAFGGKHSGTVRTLLTAMAARQLKRPVKLLATRSQGFTVHVYRAETQHEVTLAADRDGKLQAIIHYGWELSSRPSTFNLSGTETTARMYACPNIETRTHVVHADRASPGHMRCPHETTFMFAMESAMDELAHELRIDPVELRIRNDTQVEPIAGRPYSSRALVRCLREGAADFGWDRRKAEPGALREGDWLVGMGCATAAYPANVGASSARVTLERCGSAKVEVGFQEVGNGAYTVLAQVASAALGIPIDRVTVHMGDTNLPLSTMTAASNGAASTCNAVLDACSAILDRLANAAIMPGQPLAASDPSTFRLMGGRLMAGDAGENLADALDRLGGQVTASGFFAPPEIPPGALERMARGIPQVIGGALDRSKIMYGFGAQFVKVMIHPRTAQIRVPHVLGVFAAGSIISQRTAHSQLTGAMIWGISSALFEQTEIDPDTARYINANLADYLMPTNADIGRVDARFIEEEDPDVNPLSIKGIGEIGLCGMNAAIANAIFNATGRRIRDLPIRPRDLI